MSLSDSWDSTHHTSFFQTNPLTNITQSERPGTERDIGDLSSVLGSTTELLYNLGQVPSVANSFFIQTVSAFEQGLYLTLCLCSKGPHISVTVGQCSTRKNEALISVTVCLGSNRANISFVVCFAALGCRVPVHCPAWPGPDLCHHAKRSDTTALGAICPSDRCVCA